MSQIYRHGQRCELISRSDTCNPFHHVRCQCTNEYEARTCTPQQTLAILSFLENPMWILFCSSRLRASESAKPWRSSGQTWIMVATVSTSVVSGSTG
jgi:hypothetical protein